jgi:hypothetical protein
MFMTTTMMIMMVMMMMMVVAVTVIVIVVVIVVVVVVVVVAVLVVVMGGSDVADVTCPGCASITCRRRCILERDRDGETCDVRLASASRVSFHLRIGAGVCGLKLSSWPYSC